MDVDRFHFINFCRCENFVILMFQTVWLQQYDPHVHMDSQMTRV